MKLSELKTINIEAKEYFDSINANSYYRSQIILNKDLKNKEIFIIPFTAGYERQYLFDSLNLISSLYPNSRWNKENLSLWQLENIYKLKIKYNIKKDCKKSELT